MDASRKGNGKGKLEEGITYSNNAGSRISKISVETVVEATPLEDGSYKVKTHGTLDSKKDGDYQREFDLPRNGRPIEKISPAQKIALVTSGEETKMYVIDEERGYALGNVNGHH